VTLSLRRDNERLSLTITRAKITMREVTSRMLEGNIGYVALHGFSNPSAQQFHEAIEQLLNAGATSFVIDLRDNPGGYIDAANRIASEFLADGLVFTQESATEGTTRWEATRGGLVTNPETPVVLLVNGGSASASEIVAGALKERGRATIIGQHTYGKDTVQLWNELGNGGGVRITISRWFTPEHNSVAPNGVQPDGVVEVPDGTPPERDLFIERAVQFLTDRALGSDGSPAPTDASGPAGLDPRLAPLLDPIGFEPSGQMQAAA
jgi:carboxyl-terminal processing protease